MRRFLTLVLANLRMVSRNRQALFWTLAFPLVFMFLLGVMFGDEGGNTARAGIADQDSSAASQGLRSAFASVRQLVIEEGKKDRLLKKLSGGDISAVVVIPRGFGEEWARMQTISGSVEEQTALHPVRVDVYYDPSSVVASQVAKGTVSAVVDGFQKYLVKAPDLVRTEFHSMEKESLGYRDFLIPGILALALLTSGVIGIATTVVFYRQQGILRRVQVTPLPVSHSMGGAGDHPPGVEPPAGGSPAGFRQAGFRRPCGGQLPPARPSSPSRHAGLCVHRVFHLVLHEKRRGHRRHRQRSNHAHDVLGRCLLPCGQRTQLDPARKSRLCR